VHTFDFYSTNVQLLTKKTMKIEALTQSQLDALEEAARTLWKTKCAFDGIARKTDGTLWVRGGKYTVPLEWAAACANDACRSLAAAGMIELCKLPLGDKSTETSV
jgi:hypothetical protein